MAFRYPLSRFIPFRDGAACVGNHTEAVAKLIAEGQLSTVAAIILSYLRSYNPEDAYCEITFWPETTAAHRKWTYAMAAVFALIFIPTAIIMLEWVSK